jgi:hypothetical protein
MHEETIAIIGSRTFNNYELLSIVLNKYIIRNGVAVPTIVSGGAKGADSLGARYANENNYPLTVHKADWKDLSHQDAVVIENHYGKYDAKAGHRRNTLIIDDCDTVIAFTNGSPGTANSLRKAKAAGKKIQVVNF